MANCSGCPFRWHDSDCEYCSAKNDEIIDYKSYSKETCPIYQEYRASKSSESSSSSSSGSYSSSGDGSGCGCFIIAGIIVVIIAFAITLFSSFLSEKRETKDSQPTTQATQATEVTTAIVDTEGSPLNMRQAASTDSEIVTTIPKGETVQILELGTEWHYVQYGEYRGYCYASYLQIQ